MGEQPVTKFHVLFAAIVGVVVLMIAGLLTGHDGALLASSFSVIGGMAGFAFGHLGTGPGRQTPAFRVETKK